MPGPEILVGGVALVALVAYALTGGADFGGGVWDLLATGGRAKAQREAIARAIGPIWEANHVWLILVIVLLFTCFPLAFSAIGTALHIPLTLLLVGVVLRGSAFVFRAYDVQRPDVAYRWSLTFGLGSVIAPITFGLSVGALSSGELRVDVATRTVQTDFVSAWLAPWPIAVGLYTLALFSFLAATYLTNAVGYAPLREDFRRRALLSGVVAGVLAFVCLALAPAPLWERLAESAVVLAFVGLVSAIAVAGLASLALRRYRLARALVASLVALVVLGWGAAQFPLLVVPDLSLADAAAPPEVLWMFLTVLAAGSLLLIPAFVWLYRIFWSTSLAPGD
jgi:cytochrome bd ubiquinol oxidase subunit II